MLALLATVSAAQVDVRLGVGMPDVVHVQAEFELTERWDAYGRLGSNLGLITYFGASVGGRYDALIRERGARRLVLRLGPEAWFGPTDDVLAIIVSRSVELEWSVDVGAVDLLVAHSLGVGPTLDVPFGRFRLEPATPIVPLQVGLRFGSRTTS